MPVDVVMLVATAVLATVAVAAACVALRASRRISRLQRETPTAQPAVPPEPAAQQRASDAGPRPVVVTSVRERPVELAPRVVEGRVIVPPSREEVVATAVSRPQVRLSVLAHGLARAMRPESRDRIAALVRREYRQRRRHRLRAGRRAARAAHEIPTGPSDRWLGALPQADPSSPQARAESERAIGA